MIFFVPYLLQYRLDRRMLYPIIPVIWQVSSHGQHRHGRAVREYLFSRGHLYPSACEHLLANCQSNPLHLSGRHLIRSVDLGCSIVRVGDLPGNPPTRHVFGLCCLPYAAFDIEFISFCLVDHLCQSPKKFSSPRAAHRDWCLSRQADAGAQSLSLLVSCNTLQ